MTPEKTNKIISFPVSLLSISSTAAEISQFRGKINFKQPSLFDIINKNTKPKYIFSNHRNYNFEGKGAIIFKNKIFIVDDWKIVEVYDLDKDPFEKNNLLKRLPTLVKRLENIYNKKFNIKITPDYKTISVDRETLEQLKKLGYIE